MNFRVAGDSLHKYLISGEINITEINIEGMIRLASLITQSKAEKKSCSEAFRQTYLAQFGEINSAEKRRA